LHLTNRAAAIAVAKRHVDDLLPIENFTTEVEGQMGKKIKLASETDHQRYSSLSMS